MDELIIRAATICDLDSMTALLGTLFSIEADFTIDPLRQRRGLQILLDGCGKHRCLHVAEVDSRVVGMGSAQTLISTAEGQMTVLIEDLVVDDKWRDNGIGSRLLQSLETWAGRRGIRRLQLLGDRDNQAGLDFYARHGWQRTQLICLRKYCHEPTNK